jgi:transcriptional antiterminator NusG
MSDFDDPANPDTDDDQATSAILVDDEVQPDTDDEATVDEVIDSDDLLDEEAAPPVESPYDRPGRWFVVHTQSGYEKKVKQNLEARISSMNMEERIHEVVIPMEDVIEFKNGKKVVVQKKVFPGYLLVR